MDAIVASTSGSWRSKAFLRFAAATLKSTNGNPNPISIRKTAAIGPAPTIVPTIPRKNALISARYGTCPRRTFNPERSTERVNRSAPGRSASALSVQAVSASSRPP